MTPDQIRRLLEPVGEQTAAEVKEYARPVMKRLREEMRYGEVEKLSSFSLETASEFGVPSSPPERKRRPCHASITLVILACMKTAVSIPDAVFSQAEKAARRLKMSRSKLYATALAAFLEEQQAEDLTARLDAVYTLAESNLDPEWLRAQADALDREEW